MIPYGTRVPVALRLVTYYLVTLLSDVPSDDDIDNDDDAPS